MSRTKCDSSSWFGDDYRTNQFRSKFHQGDWNKTSDHPSEYSLVIVLPSNVNKNDDFAKTSVTQTDSGVGSETPSPPKSPTPDYDSLEDSFEDSMQQVSPKKVHFVLNESDSSKPKASWRDILLSDSSGYKHDRFGSLWTQGEARNAVRGCYRQKWAHAKCSGQQLLSTTVLDDGEVRKSRPESRKRTKLVRRSSSLDRFVELRFSQKNRSPLLCDPDPLKEPGVLGRRVQRELKNLPSSSLKAVEQSCGPHVKQLRSYSVESSTTNGSFSSSQLLRARQRSVSGNVSVKKTPVRRVDDEALKRSRLHNSQYELSQDLLDKQVEMLERKYGGVCARTAALTIQRAFRKYTIMKRFQDIAQASKGEKRLSRRLPTFDVADSMCNGSTPYHDAILQSCYDMAYHNTDDSVQRYGKPPGRTQSFRERGRYLGPQQTYEQCRHANGTYQVADMYQDMYRSQPAFPRHPAWTAVPSVQRTHCQQVFVNSSPGVRVQHPDSFQPTRDSVSSEDSALSSLSAEAEPCLQRGCASRHSLAVSPSKALPVGSSILRGDVGRQSDMGRRNKVPPQVPRRTSSIPCNSMESPDTEIKSLRTVDASPVWKRKSLVLAEQQPMSADDKRLSNISENSEDSLDSGGGYSSTAPAADHSFGGYPDVRSPLDLSGTPIYKLTEIQRKRQYRVGLNLFNKKPERGVRYLIQRGFLEASPPSVARFLLTRKGLSKQMIGEYLGNLQSSFNMAVLECFVQELDLAGMQVDVALRKFQTFFRMPGEAQKIERLVEVFSHRYIDCNHDIASKFHNADTVFVLAFAIIMLNTDLHTPNMKAERRMKIDEFIRNLRSIDDGHDLDKDMLVGIYERIKTNEFKMGSDHVTQVLKVQQTIVGKKPNLALPHRRLVCYCRLYEVYDVSKKERPGVHQREVFLFNDLLMVTKIFSKKKNCVTYTFRQSFPLCGMSVTLFEAPYYPHGIRLSQRVDDKVLVTFNARNEHDRSKFVEDLKESILEMDEMENLRIEGELEKQKLMRGVGRGAPENRDSGVADMEMVVPQPSPREGKLSPDSNLKRSALSNSLLDLHEQQINKPVRRGSAGSLDSGMSSAASSVSHDSSPQIVHASSTSSGSGSSLGSTHSGAAKQTPPSQASFLGGFFSKKTKNASKSNVRKALEGSSDN